MEWKTRFLVCAVLFGFEAIVNVYMFFLLEKRENEIIRLRKAPYYRRARAWLKSRKG